jgi:SAM-dependent methyltransferase
MTRFEVLYSCVRRFDHPLYQRVFRLLSDLEERANSRLRVLDVGGRRSNYTIGLKSRVWISDIPPAGELQVSLDLGATEETRRGVIGRRSNIEEYVIDDMTRTRLPEHFFDVVVAVEVLEHVTEDEAFVRSVVRRLKAGGAFIMTTPNGDFLRVPYPDHKRHYRRKHLLDLLLRHFPTANVEYAVNAGTLMQIGVHRPSLQTPLRSLLSPPALFLASRLESLGVGGQGPEGKRHLVAVAWTSSPAGSGGPGQRETRSPRIVVPSTPAPPLALSSAVWINKSRLAAAGAEEIRASGIAPSVLRSLAAAGQLSRAMVTIPITDLSSLSTRKSRPLTSGRWAQAEPWLCA